MKASSFPIFAMTILIVAATNAAVSGQPTCNPQQAAKVTSSDAAERDFFGHSVSIDGNVAVIGTRKNALGGTNVGAAYVFQVSGGVWHQVARIEASDEAPNNEFGYSVAIKDGVAVIGARSGSSNQVFNSGAAYVFRNQDGVWQEVAKLTASDGASGDRFGVSVSIDGNTAVVGATHHADVGPASGSAYVFRNADGAWLQIAKLTALDAAIGDHFGISVSLNGDTIITGAYCDADGGSLSGSAYIFRETNGIWHQVAKLTASDAAIGNMFGCSVSLDEETALIGAYGPGPASLQGGAGSAYIFREFGGTWQQIAKLSSTDGAYADWFGYCVSLDGGTAIVGAHQDDDSGSSSGSAYLYREISSVWQQVAKLNAADAAAGDLFGFCVSLSGDKAIIGAYADDDDGINSGSAYVFDLHCPGEGFPLGDLDCSGTLNENDVGPFVLALTSPVSYTAEFPNCDLILADMNGDGFVNGIDIRGFTSQLISP